MDSSSGGTSPAIVQLNVGGVSFTCSVSTLRKHPDSVLAEWFTDSGGSSVLLKDKDGRFFIDRDGDTFRHVVDFLRNDLPLLPECSQYERQRLLHEAEFLRLKKLKDILLSSPAIVNNGIDSISRIILSPRSGYITIGYQGTLSFGRQGMIADLSFRKINRILVCGKVSQCREVFGETLNEGRDPDRGHNDRYTARFYLKHTFLEQAFDQLAEAGFRMVGSCASGTSSTSDMKPSSNTEEERWAHYNEFVFYRD